MYVEFKTKKTAHYPRGNFMIFTLKINNTCIVLSNYTWLHTLAHKLEPNKGYRNQDKLMGNQQLQSMIGYSDHNNRRHSQTLEVEEYR